MSTEEGERIQANCKLIWEDFDYDIEFKTDDYVHYKCIVRKNFGL
ncbi:hypothetical protein JI435_402390 [Parastagonospora nodorum SN15]|uniref:Uncharacterized protein n=1 Tax=Phaeosphaeria nodorum (strain SN15 / ATCC MYA-4574 / FGSC 10173) TaxID=321614 RepID=A0A7U2ET85_PHANO|nr:hypothetical protein JI435_402390 [Parastagonospora nodorum SN15]